MKEFKDKGYWSKDAITQTDDSLTMFSNGKSATAMRQIGNINGLWVDTKNKHPEWDAQLVDIRPDLPVNADPAISNGTAIHATTKNPERTMAVLDLFGYDQSYFDLLFYGEEGKDYSLNSDGSIHQLNSSFNNGSPGMGIYTTLLRKGELRAPNFDSIDEDYNKNFVSMKIPMFSFNNKDFQTQTAAISGTMASYLTILNLGFADDVEKTYDKMMAQLKTAGLIEVQNEYLKQVQVFMKNFSN